MTLNPSEAPVTPRYRWAEIWTAVLTRPSVQTFQEILSDPAVSSGRAIPWVIVTWLVMIVFTMLFVWRYSTQVPGILPNETDMTSSELQTILLMSLACMVPVLLPFGLMIFRMQVLLVQFVASQLGADTNDASGITPEKTKNSDPAPIETCIIYGFAVMQSLNIISLLLFALPTSELVRLVSLLPFLYQAYLLSLLLRAVYGFSAGRALASSLISYGVFLGVLGVVMYGLVLSLIAQSAPVSS